ncbi:MAG: SPFH domain-containing protein, partial [Anaerolineae bacterium]
MSRSSLVRWAVIAGAVVVGLAVLGGVSSQHMYFFQRVDPQEIGVRFRGGRIYQVVGPGVYSDLGWFAEIQKVSIEALTFSVQDPEVVTKDRQRVGFLVSGDVFRPSIGETGTYEALWPKYRNLYLSDEALQTRINDLALQALKSCVGDRTFNDNVIGSARDELRVCIDEELNGLAGQLGLVVRNVAIPNVILSTEVQAMLDAITQSRLDTELATQDAIKAK